MNVDKEEPVMYDQARFALSDMTASGIVLRKLGLGAESMEEAANRIVRYLYDHLMDQQHRRKVLCAGSFLQDTPLRRT